MNATLEHPDTVEVIEQARSAWDTISVSEDSTKAQRKALYSLNIIRKDVVKQLSKAEASAAIDFCLKMRAGTFR